jgi:lipoprotein-releasing system permease protein
MIGVAFSTAALIIVLSVFNGLEDLLRSLNNSFDPEIKVEASVGKSFTLTDSLIQKIESIQGVEVVTEVIEDYAYARYRDANQVVTIKGVSDNFINQHRIPEENIIEGKLQLKEGKTPFAIVGYGIRNALSISVKDKMYLLQLYYIKNVKSGSINPSDLYSQKNILPGGVFSIVQNLDENYIIVPLSFAQELLNYGNKRTSLEIKTKEDADLVTIKERLKKVLGNKFSVLQQEEQHKDLYRLLKMEKLFTFLALSILLAIGSINIFFSLMMLAIDKKKDISVLSAMGANQQLIRNIFLAEGVLISFSGAFVGLILGGLFCWAQMNFGIISMGMQSSILEGYPVKIIPYDFIYTLGVVFIVTFLISIRPAVMASRYVFREFL